MVSLCNIHYSVIYNDMFRPYKWAIIRLLVEPMGRLYTRSLGRGDEISYYIILWCSMLMVGDDTPQGLFLCIGEISVFEK